MSGFDPSWLALREPYDHAVRDQALADVFVQALGPSPRLIDLGCGTGSNLRCLTSMLPADQSWLCIDNDPVLLEQLEVRKPESIALETRCLDLAARLEEVSIEPGVGVTGAALLDLASAGWLDRLAGQCADAVLLMTLSYDGRMIWAPGDPSDAAINAAFDQHQRTDKGFGPALGPAAVDHLANRLREHGHDVRLARSDWVFGAPDRSILEQMIAGITTAAREIDPDLPIDAWITRRRREIASGDLKLTVGHQDLLSLPAIGIS